MHQELWWNTSEAQWSIDTEKAVERVDDAQALFRRVLANWVSDLLVLRTEGQLQARWPKPTEAVGFSRAA